MADSVSKSGVDTCYKDTLTYPYGKFEATEHMVEYNLTQTDIGRLDIFFESLYGDDRYGDVVLQINGVAHRDELTPGDEIKLPSLNDLTKFERKYVK